MRKILFVGCGGSGGAVLGYLMDQLRADLRRLGIEDIPRAWQFVHFDAPLSPTSLPGGLGSIVDQGGTYVPVAPLSGTYELIDDAVASVGVARSYMATWAPREPDRITVPPQEGAGQMRAMGRVMLASRAKRVREELQHAVGRLKDHRAADDISRACSIAPSLGDPLTQDSKTLTFIVSSMAGGSGASMALEVSRLLSGLVPAADVAMFMCTPDVFDEIPVDKRPGVRPNALAMLGEIVATQMGEANAHDTGFFAELGVSLSQSATSPVARMIPVGRFLATGAPFGDGSMASVYRGLARALAALTQSGAGLEQYVKNLIENQHPTDHIAPSLFGWGVDDASTNQIQWGSVGYATVTMGRDRYLEYSAQRLARTALDHLLDGHVQPGDEDGGIASAHKLVHARWPSVLTALGLPAHGGPAGFVPWLNDVALPAPVVREIAQAAVSAEIQDHLPMPGPGESALAFGPRLVSALTQRRKSFARAIDQSSYRAAAIWTSRFVESVEALVEDSIAAHGLVYTKFMLAEVRQHLLGDAGASGLRTLSQSAGKADIVPGKVTELLGSLTGQITNGQVAVIEPVLKTYRSHGGAALRGAWAGLVASILEDATVGVIDPLVTSINTALLETQAAREATSEHHGVATLQTDVYAQWPSDRDHEVSARWATAHNEVLLTTPSEFPPRYELDLGAATRTMTEATPPTPKVARERAVAAVVSGRWETVGAPAPRGLLTTASRFSSAQLPNDPETGELRVPARAVYALKVSTADLLSRSRGYVERRQTSFADFASGSIRDYASDPALSQRLVRAFQEVLANAVPLSHVPEINFQALHPGSPSIEFSFSTVPFAGLAIAESLRTSVEQFPMASTQSLTNLTEQLDSSLDPTRVDVMGYFSCSAAPAYSGLLEPAREQWAASTSDNARTNYWNNRRARPLPAALAMTGAERRAMVGGWFLGQILGELKFPSSEPYAEPAQVWSADGGAWLPFPHPLLTPPHRFMRKNDWLPAVLEAHLLALSRFGQHPVGSSMAPYVALRSVWDSNPQRPTDTDTGMFELRATSAISAWLRTGAVPQGGVSKVAGSRGMEPEDRRSAAIEWVQTISDHVRADYLPGGAGKFGTIDRSTRKATPLFRDLADDVVIMLSELSGLLAVAPVGTQGKEHEKEPIHDLDF